MNNNSREPSARYKKYFQLIRSLFLKKYCLDGYDFLFSYFLYFLSIMMNFEVFCIFDNKSYDSARGSFGWIWRSNAFQTKFVRVHQRKQKKKMIKILLPSIAAAFNPCRKGQKTIYNLNKKIRMKIE